MRLSSAIGALCVLGVTMFASPQPALAASNMSYGITVSTALPKEAVSVRVGKATFLVYHGSFYRRLKAGYVLVPAPQGATIRTLPRGAEKVVIGKTTYYRHAGAFFRASGGRYQVCDAPAGIASVASTDGQEKVLPVHLGDDEYVFRKGRFFRNTEDGLIGRSAPIGAVAQSFPPDAMSVWYRNSEYFESHGVFFQEVPGGFRVIAPPWQKPMVATDSVPALVAEHGQ